MAIADAEGFNAPEGNMSATDLARLCRSAGVLRPWHAGRETFEELGKPQTLLDVENLGRWYTAPEAPKGKPGNGTMLEPTLHGGPWDRQAEKYCHRESPPHTAGVSYHA